MKTVRYSRKVRLQNFSDLVTRIIVRLFIHQGQEWAYIVTIYFVWTKQTMNAMENERKKKEHSAVVVLFTQAVRPGFKFRLSLFFSSFSHQIAVWSLKRKRHLCRRTAHGIYRRCRREKLTGIPWFLGRWNHIQTNTPDACNYILDMLHELHCNFLSLERSGTPHCLIDLHDECLTTHGLDIATSTQPCYN